MTLISLAATAAVSASAFPVVRARTRSPPRTGTLRSERDADDAVAGIGW